MNIYVKEELLLRQNVDILVTHVESVQEIYIRKVRPTYKQKKLLYRYFAGLYYTLCYFHYIYVNLCRKKRKKVVSYHCGLN